MELLIMNFSPQPCYLAPNILLNTLLSNTLSLLSPPSLSDTANNTKPLIGVDEKQPDAPQFKLLFQQYIAMTVGGQTIQM
jgi:hypothetical protein